MGGFDFSFAMEGINRQQLLEAAAQEIDLLKGHLGKGTLKETPEGAAVRELCFDEAKLPAYPEIYQITDNDFLARQRQVPVLFQEISRDYHFYWIRFPIGLAPKRNWPFNMLEVRVEFNEGGAPEARPRAYQILPAKQFQTLLKAHDSLEITLNESLEFEAKMGTGVLDADAKAVVKGGAGFVLGPFTYTLKKAKIDHNSTGMEWVFWRIDGPEFFHENTPDLIVIAQVPMATKDFHISAKMQAYRRFSFLTANVQVAIKNISQLLRGFFQEGLPIYDERDYDLSGSLKTA